MDTNGIPLGWTLEKSVGKVRVTNPQGKSSLVVPDVHSTFLVNTLGATVEDAEAVLTAVSAATERPHLQVYTLSELEAQCSVEIQWQMLGVFAPGQLTKWNGAPKVGKSKLSIAAYRAMAREEVFCGLPTTYARTLWVTEDPKDAIVEKLRLAEMNDDDIGIVSYFDCSSLTWEEYIDDAVAIACDKNYDIVAFDTLRRFAQLRGEEENTAELGFRLIQLQTALQAANKGGHVNHHSRKGGGSYGEDSSGHTSGAGATDTNLSMKRVIGDGKERQRSLYCEGKMNASTFEIVVELNEDDATFHKVGTAAEVKERSTARKDIALIRLAVEFMKKHDGVATDEEYAEYLEVNKTTAGKRLKLVVGVCMAEKEDYRNTNNRTAVRYRLLNNGEDSWQMNKLGGLASE